MRSFLQLLLIAFCGALVSGLTFARLEWRPWQAVPLGLGVSLVIALALEMRTWRR